MARIESVRPLAVESGKADRLLGYGDACCGYGTGNDVNYYYYNVKNNNYDNVYGAVIMTKINERVHPVHSMNID